MSAKEFITKFLTTEQNRDWDNYPSFLHPDIEFVFFNGKQMHEFQGRDEYIKFVRSYYDKNPDYTLNIVTIEESGPNQAIAVMKDKSGVFCMNRFDIENGQIIRDTQFLQDESRNF
ncbi:nuclear transport factor 2 family protein [Guggenheimella bovis]